MGLGEVVMADDWWIAEYRCQRSRQPQSLIFVGVSKKQKADGAT